MEKIKKVIATFYLTILFFFFFGNYEFISRNYDFITRSCEFISHNSEKKKVRIVRKSRSNLFYFCIQRQKRASIETCQI